MKAASGWVRSSIAKAGLSGAPTRSSRSRTSRAEPSAPSTRISWQESSARGMASCRWRHQKPTDHARCPSSPHNRAQWLIARLSWAFLAGLAEAAKDRYPQRKFLKPRHVPTRTPEAPMASFVSLFEFQGVLSLVTCAALQGFPPRATGLALVEALVEQVHFNPLNHCKHWLLGDCVSS